ncbi:hypothetical protein [Streptomyces umbrinus]|uniref:hypothetical protein n=1 Tax=Streptomyces umbrinus TaxID=67370 RepID=UPI003411A7F7
MDSSKWCVEVLHVADVDVDAGDVVEQRQLGHLLSRLETSLEVAGRIREERGQDIG